MGLSREEPVAPLAARSYSGWSCVALPAPQ